MQSKNLCDSTSELRVRMVPLNKFKFVLLYLVFVMLSRLFNAFFSLWSHAGKALVCDV